MKFENLEELVKYIVTENINIKYSDIKFETDVAEPVKVEESDTVSVTLDCFYESPTIEAKYGDEAILYVESFEAFKNACGTGKITMMGKEIIANLCEMDDQAHVTLPVTLPSGKKDVDFRLQIAKSDDVLVQLTKG